MKQLLTMEVNGDPVTLAVEPSQTLCEALRYDLALTGTKQGCDKGDCGACTVWVDGRPILSCISLALLCEGAKITTVEGLAEHWRQQRGGEPTALHPVQRQMADWNGGQCGFCTPGMVMSAAHFIETWSGDAPPTRDDIALALSGNLCRCTGYTKIFAAVAAAAEEAT